MTWLEKIRRWIEEGDRKRDQLKRDAGLISAYEYQQMKKLNKSCCGRCKR